MNKSTLLRELRRRLQHPRAPADCPLRTFFSENQLLPAGTVVEWLTHGPGTGAMQLTLAVARRLMQEPGELVLIDAAGECYPPGLARAGIDLTRTIMVRPRTSAEALWALEQTLQARGMLAAICPLERLDSLASRRLQLAVERSGGRALLIRPGRCRHQPSWSDLRMLVTPLPHFSAEVRRLRLDVLHRRGQGPGETIEVELNNATNDVRMVSRLADSAPPFSHTFELCG